MIIMNEELWATDYNEKIKLKNSLFNKKVELIKIDETS